MAGSEPRAAAPQYRRRELTEVTARYRAGRGRRRVVEDHAAGDQKRTPKPTLPALDMHLPVPSRPHDLCQSPGIVAVPSCSALSSSLHWPDGLRCRSPATRHASALRIATPLESKLPNRCAPAADPVLCKVATGGSGSLAARSSFMMRPVSSTTQIAVSSSDTSNPAKYLMAAPSRCLWRSDNRPRLSSRWSSHCSVLRQDPNHPI